eukprot:scaffold5185_cov198-Alexandrium_tamarense.AAC.33
MMRKSFSGNISVSYPPSSMYRPPRPMLQQPTPPFTRKALTSSSSFEPWLQLMFIERAEQIDVSRLCYEVRYHKGERPSLTNSDSETAAKLSDTKSSLRQWGNS